MPSDLNEIVKGEINMEKKIMKDIPTHNTDQETIRVIEVANQRFYDEEEYHDWNDKYSEPQIKNKRWF